MHRNIYLETALRGGSYAGRLLCVPRPTERPTVKVDATSDSLLLFFDRPREGSFAYEIAAQIQLAQTLPNFIGADSASTTSIEFDGNRIAISVQSFEFNDDADGKLVMVLGLAEPISVGPRPEDLVEYISSWDGKPFYRAKQHTEGAVHPTASLVRRVIHARSLIAQIEIETTDFGSREPFLTGDLVYDRAAKRFASKLQIKEPVPAIIGNLTADVVNALGSGIDNMTYAFTLRDAPRLSTRLTFPVFADVALWSQHSKSRLGHFSSCVASAIEAVQPVVVDEANARDHPLWLLDQLWNQTKHRQIPEVRPYRASTRLLFGEVEINTREGRVFGPFFNDKDLLDGDDIFYLEAIGDFDIDLDVKWEVAFQLGFAATPNCRSIDIPSDLYKFVEYIENTFLPAFVSL